MKENNEIQDLEEAPFDVDHAIEMGKALKRLRENQDFKKIILEGYLKEKVLASVSLLAVPAIKQRNQRGDVMEDLVAASNLSFWLMQIDQMYKAATDPVLSEQEEEELNSTTH